MHRKFCIFIAVIAFVLLIVGCAWGDLPIDAAHFPDPILREWLQQMPYFDGWQQIPIIREGKIVGYEWQWSEAYRDGILSGYELSIKDYINPHNTEVSDLSGIEYLPNLRRIYCDYSKLLKVDINGLSNLTELHHNANEPLASVNVTACPKLEVIGMHNNKNLTSVNIAECPKLETIMCNWGNVNSFIVNACPSLKELHVLDNKLTALNLSGCPNLVRLYCSENELQTLDVSQHSALEYICSDSNPLAELNVNGCTRLSEIWSLHTKLKELDVSSCIALTSLGCLDNELEQLDLSNNINLVELHCEKNCLTELDLSNNSLLTTDYCGGQQASGLKVKAVKGHYEVCLKDYVSKLENIEADSIMGDGGKPVSYDQKTGIAIFREAVTELRYNYITHSPNNTLMDVTISSEKVSGDSEMKLEAIERSSAENIISNITDNSYLNSSGNQLTESDIYNYSYSSYGKKGIAADGNSRLILRVRTTKPGTVSFSFNEDIGAKLESLSRKELSASDQLSTTKFSDGLQYDNFHTLPMHQVSAVLVAPERFPESKLINFPSDTFKVHVKFTDEDGEIKEDDLELKIEAAPVVLIHGFGAKAKASNTFVDKGNGIMPILKKAGFTVYTWDYDGRQGPSVLLAGNDNKLSEKIEKIFDDYNKNKITCTRVDLVGYSMGGLMTRQFCLSEANKKSVSYCQGMVRRVITVATPHRGSPWSEVYYKYSDLANNVMRLIVGECFTAWQDMLPGSAVTTANFPANIPMYSIYGMANDSLDALIAEYRTALMRLTPAIRVNYSGHSLLSRVSYLKWRTILILTYVRDMFHGEENDWCVSESSAQGDFSGHSSGFQHSSDFNHINICKQNVIGAEIGSLLMGDSSEFKIFGSSSSSANAVTRVADSSASTTEYSIETPFRIKVAPEVLNVNETGEAKITVISNIAINSNLYMAISNGDTESIFSVASKDAKTFELSITFTSQDTGIMEISCFSYNTNGDKTRFYVSDTARITLLKKLDSVKITSIDFTGGSTVYTNVNSETHAGLYAVDENGKYYDVSSPLAGTQWTSTKIARVNDNGCIYGLKEGSTTLTATFRGFTASINVEVLSSEEAMSEETPQIITQTLPNAIKGVSYRVGLGATGGGIIWSAKGLPAGLNIINGEITGIPEEHGTFNVEITASNSTGSVSAMFTLIVQASGTATVIDSYHFRDANLRQLILENFDTDGDGVLSIEEIDNVHSLEVNGKGITSLEGLEIFTNIEYIDCSYNNLTSLDVSPFLALKWLVCTNNSLTLLDLSENKLLINLDCTGNFIHTLDVSDNVELEELYCWSNDIHTLILGDNPKLTVIHCHDNPLGELDVTGCSGLLRLYCWNCGLETIDLSKCEQLISLDIAVNRIESLDVSNNRLMKSLCVNENPLKSIDLSNNTALVDLLLWSTDLEALDLRNCPNLELLHCHDSNLITLTVGSHPNLRELNCNNNQITLLNVSGCPALEILYCYDNEITSMVMGNNTALRDFHCDNNQISLLDVSNCPSLEYLYCPDNQITLLTMGSHAKLRELSCVNNQIKVLDVSGCSALEVLACINNQLTSLDVSVCKKLERLYCNNNYIEVLNLVENTELVTLDCSVNNLVSLNIDNCGKLLWLYCNDNSLTRLNIGGCPEFVEFVHDEFTEIVNHHSTDGDNSGESSDEDTPVKSDDQAPIVIDAPAVDLQNPTVKETIINALQAQNPTLNFTIGNDVEILMLPEKFTGIERTIDDVSSEELAAIPESEDVAVVFPVIVVEQDGVYIWGVQLDNLKVGTLINLYLLRKDSTTVSSAFQTSGYAQDTYIFLDDDGIEINTVPANKHVNIVAFMEAGKTYAPILTQSGLVSDTPDASPDTEPDTPSIEPKNNAIGSSGGGCSAVGFSVFVAIAFLLRKKM